MSATGLRADPFGLSDPYCKVYLCDEQSVHQLRNFRDGTAVDLGEQTTLQVNRKLVAIGPTARSHIARRTREPAWNEDVFVQYRASTQYYVVVRVYDYHRIQRDDFLGQVVIPIVKDCRGYEDWRPAASTVIPLKLHARSTTGS